MDSSLSRHLAKLRADSGVGHSAYSSYLTSWCTLSLEFNVVYPDVGISPILHSKKRGKIAMLIGKRNRWDTLKISPMKWLGCVVQMPPGSLLDEALLAPLFGRQSSVRPRTCHMGLRLSAGPGNASGDSWNSCTWPERGKSATLFRPQVKLDKWHKTDGWMNKIAHWPIQTRSVMMWMHQ